jgi:hypothetical protein
MISSTSRYANSKLVTQTVNGRDVIYITPSPAKAYTFQYNYYVVDGSDRIDNIAAAYISDPTQWYTIGAANPEIMEWFSVPAGTIIRIPKVATAL